MSKLLCVSIIRKNIARWLTDFFFWVTKPKKTQRGRIASVWTGRFFFWDKTIQRYFFTSTPQSFVQSKIKLFFFTFPNLKTKTKHTHTAPTRHHTKQTKTSFYKKFGSNFNRKMWFSFLNVERIGFGFSKTKICCIKKSGSKYFDVYKNICNPSVHWNYLLNFNLILWRFMVFVKILKKKCVCNFFHKYDLVQRCDSQTWYTQLIFCSQEKKYQITTLFIIILLDQQKKHIAKDQDLKQLRQHF